MIIKSKSRKVANFDQLYDYMKKGAEKHDGVHVFSKNVYTHQREKILQEFFENSLLFKKRKNSVYLYHEIISITRTQSVSVEKQQDALFHIVQEYVDQRARNNLVYGYMHNDAENNIHFHLMISSNERGGTKNLRLSKHEFDRAKKHLETWTNKHYPELQQGLVINKQAGKKTSHNGAELKKRTGKMPERERVNKALESILVSSTNKQEFFSRLSAEHLEIYTRGKAIGFKDTVTGRKYRLKTLGLENQFAVMSKQIELEQQHNKELKPESAQKEATLNMKHEKTKNEAVPEAKVTKAKEQLHQQRSEQHSPDNNDKKHR
ncbi:hypothetical protein [Pseudoalteromonas sp. JC3]|uniref:relaxase/mobilization nuclease domain-containing protein n=1 Tax=Pseudoalteromonas sp. JC3 TaxID=2810196 RepID=UPI0019D2E0BD|nr:hypothetical protein [Pseudoalteromonas sp. JC3]MBR8842402.1 hypothetical protein [Pseudoalteromonas sp. JC3]WJE09478.1 hypothetical protein QSH61_03110 [Pseudoalteromonas sp. JC3]